MSSSQTMKAKLARLKQAADVIGQSDLSKFAAASQRVADLEAQIAQLRQQILEPAEMDGTSDLLLVNARHRVWIEHCLRKLYLETSRALAERETARAKLAKSNGRTEAIKKLLDG